MTYLFKENNSAFEYRQSNTYYCPTCEGRTSHNYIRINPSHFDSYYVLRSMCDSCSHLEIWLKKVEFNEIQVPDENGTTFSESYISYTDEKLIYPQEDPTAPKPTQDMPKDVKDIFNESAAVLNLSARASAALSRLALDMLLPYLGESSGDINTRIGNLVKNGLPLEIQQALDSLRVIGNNAAHPGEMDLKDDKQTSIALLELLNFIVEDRITKPKKIRNLYSKLPKGALKGINERDKSNKKLK